MNAMESKDAINTLLNSAHINMSVGIHAINSLDESKLISFLNSQQHAVIYHYPSWLRALQEESRTLHMLRRPMVHLYRANSHDLRIPFNISSHQTDPDQRLCHVRLCHYWPLMLCQELPIHGQDLPRRRISD
jgi:hypothetical protein